MKALLSVSNKEGIVEFARDLEKLNFEIISTGGTYKILSEHNIKVSKVEDMINFPECFDGRVKTLNPYIHGAILYRRENEKHINEAKKLNIEKIDLVCVNLYPFEETIKKTDNFDEIIENIDIGGPAMIRSSAKNFIDILIVTDIKDYQNVISAINNKKDDINFRQNLMIKAFEHTANYDSIIANYMNSRFKNGFGEKQFIVGKKVFNTRYGENPHQQGTLYQFNNFFTDNFYQIKGEASFNNLTDINSAIKIVTSFSNKNAICIVKHGNPCGFSLKDNLLNSYIEALKCDPISSFGGVVAVNGIVNEILAKKMNEIFLEVIIAGDFTKEAINIFSNKKRVKLFSQKSNKLSLHRDLFDFKHIDGGFVYQNSDYVDNNEVLNSIKTGQKEASKSEMIDLEIAWKLASLTKSNSIIYVKNSTMVAIGMGMTSRVDATISALKKAKDMNINIEGSVMASEAFFPFRDTVDIASKHNITAIIQPGGSIRDHEVIESANEHNIALYFTGKRHFLH